MAHRTWFTLVDATGAPVEDCQALYVKNANTVADFLYDLVRRFRNNVLEGVPEFRIRVYESKEKLVNKDHLGAIASVQDIGLPNAPLLVVVPKRDVFYQMKLEGFPSERTFRVESTGEAFTVEDFLAAVYTRHRGLLTHYSEANFVAYNNGEAFNRTPKGGSLDGGTGIGTLGFSCEDALIVEVVELQIGRGVPAEENMPFEGEYRRYTHSELGADFDKGISVMKELNVSMSSVDKAQLLAGVEVQRAGIQPFQWGSIAKLTDEQQRDSYRSYLETHLADVLSEKKMCVFAVNRQSTFLTAVIPGTDVELGGHTDLIVLGAVVKTHPDMFGPCVESSKLAIEVKKTAKESDAFEAVSELITLSVLTCDPVTVLLTDLQSVWRFFWVGEKSDTHTVVYSALISDPDEAFAVMKKLIPPTERLFTRCKLRDMLPSVTGKSASGPIVDSIQRYYDVESMLGPDEEMARAVGDQIARGIPNLQISD